MTAPTRRVGFFAVLILALSMLGLVGGNAQAAPNDHASGAKSAATKLKASAPKTTDAAGNVTITGKLTSKGVAVADATVVLKAKTQGTKKYAVLATAVTDATGAVSYDVVQTKKHMVYKLAFAKTDTLRASRSKAKSVKLAEAPTS